MAAKDADRAKPRRGGAPTWMGTVLIAAGVYNLLWGGLTVLFPRVTLAWTGLPPANLIVWSCLGMVVGVYGVGYLIAARDPYRHWAIVFTGLLGKLLGPIGFFGNWLAGTAPGTLFYTLLFNDLSWWIPFSLILYGALRHELDPHPFADGPPPELETLLASKRDQHGRSVLERSNEKPQLVLFVRHFGCTFCRETLSDLSARRAELEKQGLELVVVHMNDDEAAADEYFGRWKLQDVSRVSDPRCELYRGLGLQRGSLGQLLGPAVWSRGLQAWLGGHGLGTLDGDGFQLGGAFVIDHGKIVAACRHQTAGDRPDVCKLAAEALSGTSTDSGGADRGRSSAGAAK